MGANTTTARFVMYTSRDGVTWTPERTEFGSELVTRTERGANNAARVARRFGLLAKVERWAPKGGRSSVRTVAA